MRIQKDVGSADLYSRANINPDAVKDKKTEKANQGSRGLVLDAGNLNLGTESIEEKRKKAQRMALGIVSDAFDGDKKIDKDLDERRQRIRDLQTENNEYTDELKRIEEFRADVAENYGVQKDSKEYADLELLRKERDTRRKDPFLESFTDEERERLAKIKEDGITDYQQEMLDLDKRQQYFQGKIDENMKMIKEENSIISGIGIERLKSHEMVDAQKNGDKIMAAASDSVIGMIIAEAKENIDEEIAEDKENAEEIKEEADKQQEKLDKARAERKAREEELEAMYSLDPELEEVSASKKTDNMPDVKKSLESVVNELKLTMQDLTGAVVDNTV